MKTNVSQKTKSIAVLGISVALIVVLQALAELLQKAGMPVSLALGLLPVLVTAQVYGTKTGALCGGFFGIVSLVIAAIYAAAIPLYSVAINPLVSVFPRVMVGMVSGLVFSAVSKRLNRSAKSTACASVIATVSGVLTNTVLFLSFFFLFAGGKTYGGVTVDFGWIVASVVSLNGLIELICFSLIVPLVVSAVKKSQR